MITLQNMVFANPQAYRVFPQIGNPYNTGITDTAIYEGYLQVTDSNGTTKSFSNTNIVDFTGFTGIIDIDQYTSIGSVKLGRWKIASSTVITNDITINVTDIEEIPADETTVTLEYEVKYNTYDNGQLISSIVVTPDSYTLQANVEWITIDGENIVISANTDTEPRQGQVIIQVSYQNYTTSANYNITQSGNTISIDIMNSMVLWYDLKKQGATNESMAENPVLHDLSGNGHDATCYNFAWSGMSGIGGYSIDYTQYKKYAKVEVTNHTIIATTTEEGEQYNWLVYFNAVNTEAPSYDIKVSGLTKSKPITYRYVDENSDIQNMNIIEDGIYTLPKSYLYTKSDNETNCGFQMLNGRTEYAVIEQLPLYPHALVSDGVDDYCLVEGLPLLNKEDGYTVIAKRKWLDEDNEGNSSLITKASSTSGIDGAFIFECKHQNATQKITRSFGGTLILDNFYTDDITYQTSNFYNSTSMPQRTHNDTNKMCMFRFSTNANEYYGEFALYSFLLFNRDLTPEEIEWVKTNLIETEQ